MDDEKNSVLDEAEELRQENEDLKLDIEDLRNELDDEKQNAFFKSNDLRQKIEDAKEDIGILKDKIRVAELSKQTTTSTTTAGSEDEDSLESGSQFTLQSVFSHGSGYASRTMAARLELDRAMREIKSLRLELVYAKSKSRLNNNNNMNRFPSDSSYTSSYFSALSNNSHLESVNSNNNSVIREENNDRTAATTLHAEHERIQKEALYLKIYSKKEKTKHEKEKERLLREIERLHQSNIFNSKEISRIIEENEKKNEIIQNLKSLNTRSNVVLLL